MAKVIETQTERLLLRQWRKKDYEIFERINSDPVVMEYYPSTLTPEESNMMANKIESLIKEKGWGFWAVELTGKKSFIGFVGLHEPRYELPVKPCIEIGWRLGREYWGKGYATEAAKASLAFAFSDLNLNEVSSFTPITNSKSRALMERLNMVNTNLNFDHPMVPKSSPLREHALYIIENRDGKKFTYNKTNALGRFTALGSTAWN